MSVYRIAVVLKKWFLIEIKCFQQIFQSWFLATGSSTGRLSHFHLSFENVLETSVKQDTFNHSGSAYLKSSTHEMTIGGGHRGVLKKKPYALIIV